LPITRISRFVPLEGKSVELFNFLNSLSLNTIASKGCLSCELLKNKDMSEFIILEKWDEIQSHINHMKISPIEDMYIIHLLGATPESQYYN